MTPVEKNNDRITSFQLMMMLVGTIIGVGVLSLPRESAKAVGPDGWILAIIGGILTLILAVLMSQVVQRFPQKTFQEIVNSLVGKVIGTILVFGFAVYHIIFSALQCRIFGEILKEYLLLYTPVEVLIIVMLLTTAYAVRSGAKTIVRLAQIIIPVMILLSIILVVTLMPGADYTNLMPVLRTPPLKLLQSIPVILFSFLGVEMILVLSPFITDVQNIPKRASLSIGIVTLIYVLMIVATTARLGIVETTHIIWPGLEVFKTVDVPDIFIENIEIYALGGWVYQVFLTLVANVFAASLMLQYLFRAKSHKPFVLPILPVVYFVALIPDNLAEINELLNLLTQRFGIVYFAIVPVVLWGISLFKKQKGSGKSAS